MAENDRDGWKRLPKLTLSSKDLSKRMKKVENATVRHAHRFIVKRWSSAREARRKITLWIVVIGVLIGATGLQLMLFQQGFTTKTAATDGTYAEGVLGPISSLNPLFATSSAEQSASELMFSRLLTYDTTGHLHNDLATNISIDDTHTVYTIKIRSDAKWSDGYTVTAQDIAYTVGLLKSNDVHSTITGWTDITATALDDTTIQFKLPATYASFEYALTFPILPKHILQDVAPANIRENSFSQTPVGSGPFTFGFTQNVDTSSGTEIIHMARNDEYYGGTAKISRYQLNVYGSRAAIVKALAASEVNSAADLAPSDLTNVDSRRYSTSISPINSGVYALLNTTSDLLKDQKIRQALQAGTDTGAIRKSLPVSEPSLDLPFVNGQITGDVPSAPAYNLDQAKQILNDDGWVLSGNVRKKDGATLRLSVVTIKNSEFERVLEVLSGQWRKLGIQVDTQVVDPNDVTTDFYQNVLQNRSYDVLLYQIDIGADPDVYAYWDSTQVHALNYSNYSNPISDDALASARARLEPDLRNAKYITFAKQWLLDVPAIGLYQTTAQYVYSKNISTYNSSDKLITPIDRYEDVLQWSVDTRTVYKTP